MACAGPFDHQTPSFVTIFKRSPAPLVIGQRVRQMRLLFGAESLFFSLYFFLDFNVSPFRILDLPLQLVFPSYLVSVLLISIFFL